MASRTNTKILKTLKYGSYNEIIDEIQTLPINPIDITQILSERFPHILPRTLGSIYGQEYQRKTKRHFQKHCSSEISRIYYNKYKKEVNNKSKPGIILRFAEEIDLSPWLLARSILEQFLLNLNQTTESMKQQISKLMKDTSLIKDKTLAFEVYLCILHDDNYGPYADIIKYSFGHEYECKLRTILQNQGLAFIEEIQMRDKGYDKTPDFKMEVPFAIDGFIVNWIESKASFGDEENHQNYLKDQFWSYWNRFGSGMVIYWFGYIEELDVNKQKGIILRSDLNPSDIVKMDPSTI
uniref:CDAN1-interacting nuclease 1 n=1 Tax=Strigamia maritima TaxID=126957 RepID=T1JCP0_STRMM